MTSSPVLPGTVTDRLWLLLAFGLAVQVAGCITAVVQAPRTEIDATGPVEKGDLTLMLVGILGFGLGGVLSLIAVIAFGVLLGMRAQDEDRAVS